MEKILWFLDKKTSAIKKVASLDLKIGECYTLQDSIRVYVFDYSYRDNLKINEVELASKGRYIVEDINPALPQRFYELYNIKKESKVYILEKV